MLYWPSRLDPAQKGCELLAHILYDIVSAYWDDGLQLAVIADGPFQQHLRDIVYFGHRRVIGMLVGAEAPVVLTSRADNMEAKLLSIAGAVLMVNQERATRLKVGKVHF